MNEALVQIIGLIVPAAIASAAGYLTAKASARGSVSAASVTSMAELEKQAGERAMAYYSGALDDARQRLEDGERRAAERLAAAERRAAERIAAADEKIESLRAELKQVRFELSRAVAKVRRCEDVCSRLDDESGTGS